MSTAIQQRPHGTIATVGATAAESAMIEGDISKLQPAERVQYYIKVCESLGLNYLTKPFEYIRFQGTLRLYARKDTADQLRKLHNISISIVDRIQNGDIYRVVARATTPDGRADEDEGAVNIGGVTGDALANKYMLAITKAKRRVALSICGLGWSDESELDGMQGAQKVAFNVTTGALDGEPTGRPTGSPPSTSVNGTPGSGAASLSEADEKARKAEARQRKAWALATELAARTPQLQDWYKQYHTETDEFSVAKQVVKDLQEFKFKLSDVNPDDLLNKLMERANTKIVEPDETETVEGEVTQ